MAITLQPFVRSTSFNFWLGAIDALYLLIAVPQVHNASITGPMIPASALIDNTADNYPIFWDTRWTTVYLSFTKFWERYQLGSQAV